MMASKKQFQHYFLALGKSVQFGLDMLFKVVISSA
jgi:hypothetical protein